MDLLSTTPGTRPRLACEVRPEGVSAARREDGSIGVMAALSSLSLPPGALRPGLRDGNVIDRVAVVGAVRQALEKVFDRSRQVTLIVPDAAVRVLLLDFDALPGKPAEALPVVRFRLKKMLPFEAEDAAVSYQVMSSGRGLVRVVAVAMPREVLTEYEAVVREAGFEPGVVLPSTLAVLAGLEESEAAALLVNAGPEAVTMAIVRSGVLLLHRSVDMRAEAFAENQPEPVATPAPAIPSELLANPLDAPLLFEAEVAQERSAASRAGQTALLERTAVREDVLPVSLPPGEVVQAISVAAAYFEDTLAVPLPGLMAAGVTSAAELTRLLATTSLAGLKVREMVDAAMLPASAPSGVPRGWLAGIRGALRS